MSQIIEVTVPDIGEYEEVELIEVAVTAGEKIKKDQTLIVLESDKASMEIPSEHDGIVVEVFVQVGKKLSKGDTIAKLDVSEESNISIKSETNTELPLKDTDLKEATALEKEIPVQGVISVNNSVLTEAVNLTKNRRLHATPSIRKIARELGVDIENIRNGSGRKGRILKEDVNAYVKQALLPSGKSSIQSSAGITPIPAVDFSKFGVIEEQPLNRIKQLTGEFLSRNWLNLPMVTHHDEADVTELEAFRKSLKNRVGEIEIKVTGLVFIMKALVGAMKVYPQFNSSLSSDGKTLILKRYFHIGIAVDTSDGLVVPVIRNVDQKSLFEISAEVSEISQTARSGKLKPSDLQGGCITISSLGGIGGQAFTPIVNAPEVAILGVSRSALKPVWNGHEFIPRLMMPLDLTYDHRVIDGADGARFMKKITELLGDIRLQLL